MESNFLFHRDSRLTIYHGDACEVLRLIPIEETFCFTAPPAGIKCIELLKLCQGAVVYCASVEIFREYWREGWRQIVAEHRSRLNQTRMGSSIFTSLISTCSDGMDIWFDCTIGGTSPDTEPGHHLASRSIREMCHSLTVLDPFAGRGGTVSAALEAGLDVIAIDNRLECCEHIKELFAR